MEMKSFSITVIFTGLMCVAAPAQSGQPAHTLSASLSNNHNAESHSAEGTEVRSQGVRAFLASEEGRARLQAAGHPLAQAAIQAFGEPPAAALQRAEAMAREIENANNGSQSASAAQTPCSATTGTRFNLEPRANAVVQNAPAVDFLPNRLGSGADLIVETANDFRGVMSGKAWDQSISGYYVHRATTADCSVQFEGGLPALQFQGNSMIGIGGAVVAADPARDAVFVADARNSSSNQLTGIGIFRASASTLLDSKACPGGTHLEAQAESCWTATAPVLVGVVNSIDFNAGDPTLAVDERSSGFGKGAGDLYVIFSGENSSTLIAACTNALRCSKGMVIAGTVNGAGGLDMHVRSDGAITISYLSRANQGGSTINFVTCTPGGAPKPPVCGTPHAGPTIAIPLPILHNSNFDTLANINVSAVTTLKHASRAESGGKFTTFLVYNDCKATFTDPSIQNAPTWCLTADVKMTFSPDNGVTWSTPASVDTASEHHLMPTVTTDASTGIVNIVYYSTEGGRFNHEVRVLLNQIKPGGTTVGPAQSITTVFDAIDDFAPSNTGAAFFGDTVVGASARGNGTSGQTRLYTSFDSTAANGIYKGKPLRELNNAISVFSF
jgi:hypothetical protein